MEYRYYKGRPAKHRSRRRRGLTWFLAFSLFIVLAPLILSGRAFFAALKWLQPHPSFTTVLNGVFFFLLSCYLLFGLFWILRDGGRIVPYFKKAYQGELGQGTSRAGVALAAQCEELDRLAIRMNVAPLSRFGFNDDRDGEIVEWHDPEVGLRTVAQLIHTMAGEKSASSQSKKQATLADLEKLRAALERAQAQGVLFCQLVRFEHDAWSLQEAELRQGSFT
jgi:hypothetical protein